MARGANDNNRLVVKLNTTSREQLIDVSCVIANAFDRDFLYDPKDIPYVLIIGSGDGGKSMMVEAMMKTFLDGYNPEDMKHPDAPRKMFIENYSAEATDRYCQVIGSVNDVPVMLGFDRITGRFYDDAQNQLIRTFRKAAKSKGLKNPSGAIFSSNEIVGATKPWVVIELERTEEWNRSLEIEVINDNLKSSSRSREYWSALNHFGKSGKLPEKFIFSPSILLKDLFSKYNSPDEIKVNKERHREHVQILKFMYWNDKTLGLNKMKLAEIVGLMSDLDEGEKVDNFINWVKSKGDDKFLSQISGSQSKLRKVFFRYAAPDRFYFDFEAFVERACNNIEFIYGAHAKKNIFHSGQGASHERRMMKEIAQSFLPNS